MGTCSPKMAREGEGEEARILMLGLEEAGKTTLLYRIRADDPDDVTGSGAAVRCNLETLQALRAMSVSVWDVGGGPQSKPLWTQCFDATDVLIFVVDAGDGRKLARAGNELHKAIQEPGMEGVPLLVVANKADLENACTAEQLVYTLGLDMLLGKWHLQRTCALTGKGVPQLMDVLVSMVRYHKAKNQ